MRRLSVLSALILSAGFVASQLAVGASVQPNPNPSHARVEIKLKASNGLSAKIENDGADVSLTINGHRQYAVYTARGEVSPTRVEAQFGRLGEVSLEFRPTHTVESTKPNRGCRGEAWRTEDGVFTGTIRFRGEHDYVEIDAGQAKGRMEATPDWRCNYSHASSADRRAFEEVEEEGDVATLMARQQSLRRYFGSYAVRDPKGGNYTFFVGASLERREGVRVIRVTAATARASTFTFSHERGRAAVSPPWPFRGSARFRRAEHGPNSWWGSLRVPLLGGDVVPLAGRGFAATLKRDFPSD